jgi:hypothetical protein
LKSCRASFDRGYESGAQRRDFAFGQRPVGEPDAAVNGDDPVLRAGVEMEISVVLHSRSSFMETSMSRFAQAILTVGPGYKLPILIDCLLPIKFPSAFGNSNDDSGRGAHGIHRRSAGGGNPARRFRRHGVCERAVQWRGEGDEG